MRVWVEEDVEHNVFVIRHQDVVLDSQASIRAWEAMLMRALRTKLGSRRARLLIDLSGFALEPSLAAEYGPIAKRVVSGFATHAIRYQPGNGLTAASIRTAAVKYRFPSNICDSRESALRLLASLPGHRD